MALISICDNDDCWQRKQCYRWAQHCPPGSVDTHVVVPTPDEGEPCDNFVALMPGDRLRPEAR